jgi:MFS family permease
VTHPGLAADSVRLWIVAGLVALCVVPILLVPLPSKVPAEPADAAHARSEPSQAASQREPVARMWIARLAVQISEATLFAYLYFWLSGIDHAVSDNQTARLFSVIMLVSAPLALMVGRWSDRADRPIAPLQACALIAAAGLLAMALTTGLPAAMLAYGLFGVSSSVFLALHSAQTLRILPRPDRRGRDLGLFNLANTLPSLVMPWLAIALIPLFGFPALFLLLALLAGFAGILLRPLAQSN